MPRHVQQQAQQAAINAGLPADAGADSGAWSNSAMDVVLGLLATGAGGLPFAPLKEAVEQLFRHACGLLTQEGTSCAAPLK